MAYLCPLLGTLFRLTEKFVGTTPSARQTWIEGGANLPSVALSVPTRASQMLPNRAIFDQGGAAAAPQARRQRPGSAREARPGARRVHTEGTQMRVNGQLIDPSRRRVAIPRFRLARSPVTTSRAAVLKEAVVRTVPLHRPRPGALTRGPATVRKVAATRP